MNSINRIVDAFGGVRPFARAIGKSPSTVQYWIERGGLPGSVCKQVLQAADDQGVGLTRAIILEAVSKGSPEQEITDMSEDWGNAISSIEEIIEDARNGRMYILVDAEDRENEGDLIIPAQFATPDAVNFMATFGRGLICLAMTRERSRVLDGLTVGSRESSCVLFCVVRQATCGACVLCTRVQPYADIRSELQVERSKFPPSKLKKALES